MRPRQVCRGKPGLLGAYERPSASFNEAPASLPGKAQNQPILSAWSAAASMRPRQVCRGKPSLRAHERAGALGFNEAPASLPGKDRARPERRVDVRGASMRPRQVCRGKRERRATRCCSTGGRFNEAPASLPGKVAPPSHPQCLDMCFNEAPASLPGKGGRLQLSRVQKITLQ